MEQELIELLNKLDTFILREFAIGLNLSNYCDKLKKDQKINIQEYDNVKALFDLNNYFTVTIEKSKFNYKFQYFWSVYRFNNIYIRFNSNNPNNFEIVYPHQKTITYFMTQKD